jgi:hypothetical protein
MLRKLLIVALAFLAGAAEARNPRGGAVGTQAVALPSVAGLHVCGNRICNSGNQSIQLRGVNKAGTEYMCLSSSGVYFDGPSDASDITALGNWAIDVVRIPLNEQCWLGINGLPAGGSAAAYQAAIVAYVNLLTSANIAAIVDLQWAAPGTTPANQLVPMPDADHAPDFWTSVANTFKNNSSVILDVYNEPYPDNNSDSTAAWNCLKSGGTCVGFSYQAASMQSLVNAIRNTGATNVIMVPGPGFAYYLDQWIANKPTDPLNNLAASFHYYPGQVYDSTYIGNLLGTVVASYPLIQGELGENDCQHVNIDPWMAYHDAHGDSYLGWAWNTYDCSSFPSLISNFDGTPTAFGVGFRDHLLTLAGRTPPPGPPVTYFTNTYPFGIGIGRTTNYTATDGTVYYPDVSTTGMTVDSQYFATYSNGASIANTPDQVLYQAGRTGVYETVTINVPNGNYTVTLGIAPATAFTQSVVNDASTASINNAGEFGQDQTIQGQKVGTCIWSSFSGTNPSPYSTPSTACPGNSVAAPTVNRAQTVSYNVSVFNQALTINLGAAFGASSSGAFRNTILNTIKVAQAP